MDFPQIQLRLAAGISLTASRGPGRRFADVIKAFRAQHAGSTYGKRSRQRLASEQPQLKTAQTTPTGRQMLVRG